MTWTCDLARCVFIRSCGTTRSLQRDESRREDGSLSALSETRAKNIFARLARSPRGGCKLIRARSRSTPASASALSEMSIEIFRKSFVARCDEAQSVFQKPPAPRMEPDRSPEIADREDTRARTARVIYVPLITRLGFPSRKRISVVRNSSRSK